MQQMILKSPLVVAEKKQLAKNDIRLKVSKKDNFFDLKFLIRHPMETGRRIDKINNKLVPKDYIASLSISINDKIVFDSHLSRSVSKNPFMHLKVQKLFAGDVIKVNWIDNKNKVYKYKKTINEI